MTRTPFGALASVVLAAAGAFAQTPRLVLDARPGSTGSIPSSGMLIAPSPRAGEVFLTLDDGVHGAELWLSDGSSAGTRLLLDLSPGPASTTIWGTSARHDGLWFVVDAGAQRELWHSDGTTAGTRVVLVSGAPMMSPPQHWFVDDSFLFAMNGQLWRSDGTQPGTVALGLSESSSIFATGGLVLVHTWPTSELWQTDGTPAGTVLLAANVAMATPALGGVLVVQAGANQSTLRVIGVSPSPQATVNEPVFAFTVGDVIALVGTNTLWRWDGTSPPQVLHSFATLWSSSGGGLLGLAPDGRGLFIHADDGTHGFEPWWSDLTPAGTNLLGDFTPGPASSVLAAAFGVGSRFVFWMVQPATGSEPWATDGTPAGTQLLGDLEPGPGSSTPDTFSGIGGIAGERRVLMPIATSALGNELWISDGTSAGTRLLGDVLPGPGSSISPWTFWGWTAGTRFVYAADDGARGFEPYAVDLDGARSWLFGGCTRTAVYSVGDPVLGATWALRAGGLDPLAYGVALIALPAATPLDLGGGCLVQLDLASSVMLAGITPDAVGRWSGAFLLPNTPSLRGAALVTQAVFAPSTHPLGFDAGTAWFVTLGY